MKVFCTDCAARALADITLDPAPRAADYILEGRSLCGTCALPLLYKLAADGS